MTTSEERKEAIARLVQRGGLRHEHAGQYFPEGKVKDPDFPEYDTAELQRAFPDALQMNFDDHLDSENHVIGTILTVADGKGPDARIPLGPTLPVNTEALIQRIRDHYRGEFDLEGLKATEDAFAGFEDEEA